MTAVQDLVAVVDRLLAPEGGCVWNREQTHASLARYAVEESYELVDAIDAGDERELREELGDVLYQVVLHAGIADGFDLEDVAAGVRDKMIRRHPHVFGDERAETVEDVVRVWRAAKAAEKVDRRSVFDGVPRAMPPMERAVKLLERLEEHGDVGAAVSAVAESAGGAGGAGVAGAVGGAGAEPGDGETGVVGAAGVVRHGQEARPGSSADGVDLAWGAAELERIAAARAAGIDPVASLRAAAAALEEVGRADEVGRAQGAAGTGG